MSSAFSVIDDPFCFGPSVIVTFVVCSCFQVVFPSGLKFTFGEVLSSKNSPDITAFVCTFPTVSLTSTGFTHK